MPPLRPRAARAALVTALATALGAATVGLLPATALAIPLATALADTPAAPAATGGSCTTAGAEVTCTFATAATGTRPGRLTVPDGVRSVALEVRGAQGGAGSSARAGAGGLGDAVDAVVPVTRGEVLTVRAGRAGRTGRQNGAGGDGAGPGGRGGVATFVTSVGGGGGGGSSVTSSGGSSVVAAGGGGGGGGTNLIGASGGQPAGDPQAGPAGGDGQVLGSLGGGGGGGGGYRGGEGGTGYQGGHAGVSHADAGLAATTRRAVQTGAGQVVLRYTVAPAPQGPDLAVTVAAPDELAEGRSATALVTVTNHGDAPAHDVDTRVTLAHQLVAPGGDEHVTFTTALLAPGDRTTYRVPITAEGVTPRAPVAVVARSAEPDAAIDDNHTLTFVTLFRFR